MPGEQRRRTDAGIGRVDSDNGVADDFGGRYQERVLDEQLVFVGETGSEGRGEQLGPQFPLEPDAGHLPRPAVEGDQVRDVQGMCRTSGTEALRNFPRRWGQAFGGGEDTVEPDDQPVDVEGPRVEHETRHGGQLPAVQVIEVPLDSVGQNADVSACRRSP
jgi:hypothetical protein